MIDFQIRNEDIICLIICVTTLQTIEPCTHQFLLETSEDSFGGKKKNKTSGIILGAFPCNYLEYYRNVAWNGNWNNGGYLSIRREIVCNDN